MGAAAPGHRVWLPLLLAKLFSALPAKSLCSAPAKRRSRGTPCWGGTEKRWVPLPVPLHKQLQESSRLTGSQRSPRLWPGLLVLCSGPAGHWGLGHLLVSGAISSPAVRCC